LPTERTRLHRKLAEALTANPELRATGPGYAAVELAEHWWEAGAWLETLHASILAGDAMAALLAMPEAYAHYEHAITACEHLPEEQGRRAVDYVGLLLKAADVAYLASEPPRSVELVEFALAELGGSDARRAAIAYTMFGRNAWANGDAEGAFTAYEKAKAVLPSDSPSVELAGVIAEEARGLMLSSHYQDGATRARDAIAVAQAIGARAEEGHALNTLGCCIAELGDFDTGVSYLREALTIAEEVGHPDHLNRAYGNITHVLNLAGRLEECAAFIFDDAIKSERLVGFRLNAAGQNCSEALIRLGR